MIKILFGFFAFLIVSYVTTGKAFSASWKAQWISAVEAQHESNSWLAFQKTVTLKKIDKLAVARIAADSKYWLWINDQLVVFEGALKRGPSPQGTYYDEVPIGQYLKSGDNSIKVLLWYFGKGGFSHVSSGTPGFLFDCQTSDWNIMSDKGWNATVLQNFEFTNGPYPNYRLPESNIRYNASKGKMDFAKGDFGSDPKTWKAAKEFGFAGVSPWNDVVERPIPMFRDYGLKAYESVIRKKGVVSDTLWCKLPYNAQVTPYLKINAPAGLTIDIRTENYMGGGSPNVRGEYVSAAGIQEYESLGWMNGHNVIYVIPKEIEVLDLKYRETGYNCDFAGSFTCNDPFYNLLWKKASRTLYITMRDNYMDCPDRERAQWWGDLVSESGEAFYALSPEAAELTKKGMIELINWQRADSTLFSPIPASNWFDELSGQMLASIGKFGFWNYYLNTGDKKTIEKVYGGVKKYLGIWKLQNNGILVEREGDWYWGDWGEKVDKQLLFNAWYYLALDGYKNMSELLGKTDEARLTRDKMLAFKTAFNTVFWDGNGYRTKAYDGQYDDRAQGLAVVASLVPEKNFPKILKVLSSSFLSSPYMEKYVLEALCQMGQEDYALERMKKRFGEMVNDPVITTLWEGWGIGEQGYGGGTMNHAWSGGGLTILSQYITGISPLEPGFKTFQIRPRMAGITNIETKVPSFSGDIELKISVKKREMELQLVVPDNTVCMLVLSDKFKNLTSNGMTIYRNSKKAKSDLVSWNKTNKRENDFKILPGKYKLIASEN